MKNVHRRSSKSGPPPVKARTPPPPGGPRSARARLEHHCSYGKGVSTPAPRTQGEPDSIPVLIFTAPVRRPAASRSYERPPRLSPLKKAAKGLRRRAPAKPNKENKAGTKVRSTQGSAEIRELKAPGPQPPRTSSSAMTVRRGHCGALGWASKASTEHDRPLALGSSFWRALFRPGAPGIVTDQSRQRQVQWQLPLAAYEPTKEYSIAGTRWR